MIQAENDDPPAPDDPWLEVEGWLGLSDWKTAFSNLVALPNEIAEAEPMRYLRAHAEIFVIRRQWAMVESACDPVLENLPGETWVYQMLIRALREQGKETEAEDFRQRSAVDLLTVAEGLLAEDRRNEAAECLLCAVELEPKTKKAILANPVLKKVWTERKPDESR